ncbi:MAG: alanine--tRNA ligase [bacterium]
MKSREIREKYLNFFAGKGHTILPGSSLVPSDPTVLLTLAGMLQFKPIFLGQERPKHRRATTVQKCIRMIDVEQVGQTKRHHTFFEMLGNFSFGDYFKSEAIQFAWELLTKEFNIPVTKLKIAIYEKDDEAFELWNKAIGLPKEIIYRLGEDNNFWSAGPTGPCGPCSEIYYDLGPEHGCGKPDCAPGCDCDRFLEIWNLVFIQYDRNEKGELIPLKQKGIDTGMGLERITAVLQGVSDNFETDIFTPLLNEVGALAKNHDMTAAKIIADHSRAITHLIADGVSPSNGGRGYVLRRLIRRAVSFGKKLGIDKPFIHNLAHKVVEMMGEAYPNLKEKETQISAVILEEEQNFFATLEQGLKWFGEIVGKGTKTISGEDAFKLHDTYGFPLDLTVELAGEKGLEVDKAGFEKAMAGQKERARRSGLAAEKKNTLSHLDLSHCKPTRFDGYEKTAEEAKVSAFFPEEKLVALDHTPFYGESGGQCGDTGLFSFDHQELIVSNTFISPKGVFLHQVDKTGDLKVGAKIKATIDAAKRKNIEAHHTATHLLQKALREVLGDQVKQAGSAVGPDKLRFDFNHFHALSAGELQKIEEIVNQKIKEKIKVDVLQRSYKEALELGATALFGEKYGDKVRVIKIDNYSLELCGGTHVKNTADIVFFKILSEGTLGSGIRRIEAIAGQPAKVAIIYQAKALQEEVEKLLNQYRKLQSVKGSLGGTKVSETNIFEIEVTELESIGKAVDDHDPVIVNKFLDHLSGRVDWLKERVAKAEKEVESLKAKNAGSQAQSFLAEIKELGGKKVLLKTVDGLPMNLLRSMADTLQTQMKTGVIVLVSILPERLIYLILVSEDLVKQGLSAKKLAEVFAPIVSGKGGGKDGKVEGGGTGIGKIGEGLAAIEKLLA